MLFYMCIRLTKLSVFFFFNVFTEIKKLEDLNGDDLEKGEFLKSLFFPVILQYFRLF